MELLPELKKLKYNPKRVAGNAFDAFINVRANAGNPVIVVRY
jgi:hypothetical protein